MCVTRPSGTRITDSIYLYGEYDYAYSDKIRIPSSLFAKHAGAVVSSGQPADALLRSSPLLPRS
jgi:hypothetical protein